MKSIFALLSLLVLAPLNAQAVTVRNCPSKLRVQYSNFYVNKTVAQITEELSVGWTPHPDDAADFTEAFATIKSLAPQDVTHPLEKAKGGRCLYRTDRKKQFERAELYTTKGKNMLRVETEIGPRGILLRTYVKVVSISPKEVVVEPGSAGLALAVPRGSYNDYAAGGDLVYIGRVGSVLPSVP